MGAQSTYSKVKSISKEYLIKFVKSEFLRKKVWKILINITLFLSYCLNYNWENHSINFKFNNLDQCGIKMLKVVGKTNKVEINKLFSEWDNRINNPYTRKSEKIKKNPMKIIKKAIRRKNFKFPWSFREIHTSFFETFISFLEILKFNSCLLYTSPSPRD